MEPKNPNQRDHQTPGVYSSSASPSPSPGVLKSEAQAALLSRLPIWVKLIMVVAFIGLVSAAFYTSNILVSQEQTDEANSEEFSADPEEIAQRPVLSNFTLTEASGEQKHLADFKGSVVLLSFWASWCTPCLVELPTFGEIEDKYRHLGLKVLAINVDEGEEGRTFAKDFWAKNSLKFPSFFDATKEVASQFEVDVLPSNFVIDRNGRLAFSGFGANDWTSTTMTEVLEKLIREQ